MKMENKLPAGLILPDGTLNERRIARREPIYKGMNGQSVERIYDADGNRFIYKPLTNDEQFGLERWVYENVLPSLPPLYPELLASACDSQSGLHWLLFEDVGPLRHEFDEETAARLVREMAAWHSLPAAGWAKAALRGQKPHMEAIESELRSAREETMRELAGLDLPPDTLEAVFAELGRERAPIAKARVLSHGDLHLGNYGLASAGGFGSGASAAGGSGDKRLVVLDWEHAHLNSPLWDLYHMIDMSHPRYPKRVTAGVRERLLRQYAEARAAAGSSVGSDAAALPRQYARFACAFSIWMLRLIRRDLESGGDRWPRAGLLAQLAETTDSLVQCRELLR